MIFAHTIQPLVVTFVFVVVPSLLQADEPRRLVATALLQDEPRRLPADNTALFAAAAKEVTIQLDLLAEVDQASLADTLVTVVDEQGGKREFLADDSGKVMIKDAKAGPHAIVAANAESHGSILLNFREAAADADTAIAATQMPILSINADALLPVVDQYLSNVSAPPADVKIDSEMVGAAAPRVGYQVRLGDGGVLKGQVYSIVMGNSPGSDVAGTRIIIYKSGTPVAATNADSQGRFQFDGIRPGVHGLIAAGPAGYAAFAFTALAGDEVAMVNRDDELFVTAAMAEADILPVVLIPPSMVPAVVDTLREFYIPLLGQPGVPVAGMGGLMGGLGGLASTAATSGASAPSGGSSIAPTGGLGALAGAAFLVPVAVAVAADGNAPGIVASPSGLGNHSEPLPSF